MAEERYGFFCVGGGGLLEKNVFAGAKAFEGPFIVQAVGEGVVYAVYGGVVDEIYGMSASGRTLVPG